MRAPVKPAARQKERELRQRAVDKAQTAWDAEGRHAKRAASIQAEIEAIEEKARAEPLVGTRKRAAGSWICGLRGTERARNEPPTSEGTRTDLTKKQRSSAEV